MTSPLNYQGGRQFPQSILDDLDKRLKMLESVGKPANAAQDEREVSQLIDERDSFEHMGTVLANKVAELLDADVGEWSSANNPIFRAIHLIEDRLANVAQGAEAVVDALEETQGLLVAMLHEKRPAQEIEQQIGDNRTALQAFASAAPPAQTANVSRGAEAVATVKVYETYTGQNGWIEVTQEEYDRTKDKYEHRIRRVSAPPAQTALTDDARDAARYRWLRDGEEDVFCVFGSNGTWGECGHIEIYGDRLDEHIDAALTAAQSASGDTK